jgi:hypothetical protein
VPSPTTPAEALEQKLAELDAEIARLRVERELHARALAVLREDLTERGAGHLTLNDRGGKAEGMIPQVRVRHSQGKNRKLEAAGTPPSRVVVIANAAGYSLHSLAEKIAEAEGGTYSASALSQAATKDGIGMPATRAKLIQKLTRSKRFPKGIEPTAEFWPKIRLPGV